MIDKAMELVKKLFNDSVDGGGASYINHLIHVATKMDTEEGIVIGLLHDVIEDTDYTRQELENEFGEYIAYQVYNLTRFDVETYSEYIDRFIDHADINGLMVKKYDLEHNMDLTRLLNVTEKDVLRLKKRYLPAWFKVNNRIKEVKFNSNLE